MASAKGVGTLTMIVLVRPRPLKLEVDLLIQEGGTYNNHHPRNRIARILFSEKKRN
jgi:hypothetical protein